MMVRGERVVEAPRHGSGNQSLSSWPMSLNRAQPSSFEVEEEKNRVQVKQLMQLVRHARSGLTAIIWLRGTRAEPRITGRDLGLRDFGHREEVVGS